MRILKYYAPFGFVPLALAAFWFAGLWTLALPALIFGLLPMIERRLPADSANLSREDEAAALETRFYDWALYAVVPAQVGLLLFFLQRVSSQALQGWDALGAVWTMGICCGIFGINVAHELGHRHKAFEQFLAKTLLLTALYMHFFIEHNRGHHVRIATDDDPASARFGESLYRFWPRSVVGGWLSAWSLEGRRLNKRGLPWWSPSNQMLRFQGVQLAAVAAVWGAFGARALLAFLASAALGFLMLETVNYIEHYGLRRERRENGRWERVDAAHSWNSDHQLGRVLLFELTRHSDHHLHAGRKYQVLRSLDDGPQMPAGYPAMMTLAMVPPLWFRVMNPRIEAGSGRDAAQPRGGRVASV